MAATRDEIIETACDLLELQGYHATGLNEIVRVSGAAKGSLYYHFPDGKEEITEEAIRRAGRLTAERIRAGLAGADDPAAALRAFVERIAYHVEESGFRAGGPLTAVAMETAVTSERLNAACRAAYGEIESAFAGGLAAAGLPEPRAGSLARVITAAVEGGILLSRTYHSGDPLRQAAAALATLIRAG